MRITESRLRKIIRSILLEKGPAKSKVHFESERELNAHLIVMPMICDKGHRNSRAIYTFYEDVIRQTGTAGAYDQHYANFVINKNPENVEVLIREIDAAKKSERNIIDTIDAEYLRSTLKDNLPVIIRAGVGDGIETRKSEVITIKESDRSIPQWLIHDLFHVHEVPSRATYPGDPMSRRGYMKIPRMVNYGPDGRIKKESLVEYGVNNVDKAEKNIIEFFKINNFTPKVDQRDLYPSILSYIVMHIESRDVIEINLKRKLGGSYITNDVIKIFEYMYHFVERYDKWLMRKKNRNKIFISTADHDVMYNDAVQDR